MGTTMQAAALLRETVRGMVAETRPRRPSSDEHQANQDDREALVRFTRQARRALAGTAHAWTTPRVDRDPGAYWKVTCLIDDPQAARAALKELGLRAGTGGRGAVQFGGAPDGIGVQLFMWQDGARLTFSKRTRLPN